ncbi:hypothetical protein NT6N_28770 [Oceaniferula spumae]|uniref:ATP-grasp domain-containing protein n=1 Tax=Oceaniferula spumae TaxID=2979115 RepID=A0AAT9FNY5_9BACT
MSSKKKLLLCEHKNHGVYADLDQIKSHLSKMAPELRVKIISGKMGWFSRMMNKGATVLSLTPWKHQIPKDSELWCGVNLSKSEECQRLEDHGIPVPRWHLWKEGQELPAEMENWGTYVVRKPDVGSRGAEVKIVRRSRLKWRNLEVKYRNLVSEPFLQEFIYTGRYPISYRVGSFLGGPLYSVKIEAAGVAEPLMSKDGFDGGATIVANTKQSRYTLCMDEEVLKLASQAHRAFPEIPLLGVDIIKDCETGKLWVLEVNASGHTWHLSSEVGREVQEKHQLDFHAQFGGLQRAAELIAAQFGN